MKKIRFENVRIVYGEEDIQTKLTAICVCIAESESYQSEERESA